MKKRIFRLGDGAVENLADASEGFPSCPESNRRAIILLSFLLMAWIAILFFESTLPSAKFLGLIPQLDKVAHFGAFGILALLVCRLCFMVRPKSGILLFFMPLLVVTVCGVIEESIQLFVPGRMASIPDLLADIGGAVFAILVANRMGMGGMVRGGSMRENF